jgi:hypothetical protein
MRETSQDFLDNIPKEKPVQRDYQMPRIIKALTPSQRLVLSVFLFMDVGILCFAVLFLFGKISLPV